MNFDFTIMEAVAFRVCTRQGRDVQFFEVPIAPDVRAVLGAMARGTIETMHRVSDLPVSYDASEMYGGLRHLSVGLDNPVAAFFSGLRRLDAFEPGGGGVLRDPRTVFCYVGKFSDSSGDVCLASSVRRLSRVC